jgi:hypothetical protein
MQPGKAEGRIGFIHGAVAGHAQAVLGHAVAIAKGGFTLIPGLGIDF